MGAFKELYGIESLRVVIRQGLHGADATEMRIQPQRFRGWESGVLEPEDVLDDYRPVLDCRNSHCRAGGLYLGPILTRLADARTETAELTERCKGQEGPKMQVCQTRFKIAVTIRYVEASRRI
jgi:hypothetical protein